MKSFVTTYHEKSWKGNGFVVFLSKGLLLEADAGQVSADGWRCRQEELSIQATMLWRVAHVHQIQSFAEQS